MESRKKAILCPNCRKLVSSDEPRCPYCGHPHPGASWKGMMGMSGFANSNRLIRYIIYVNIGMYAFSLLLSAGRIRVSLNPLTALSPDSWSLVLLGASGTIPIDHYHRWFSLITANYLHGSLLHIFFNMLALHQLAPLVTREFGSFRFIVIYALGGVFGFWVSYLAGTQLSIGASAAICALIGAIFYYSKSRGGTYGRVLFREVGGWLIGLFLIGLIPGVDNWGHAGGLIAGGVLGYLLGYNEKRKENFTHRLFAYGIVLVTGFVLAGALTTAILSRIGG